MTRGTALHCPGCGSADQLSLSEVTETIGTTDYGRIERDRVGHLIPPGPFHFEPGSVTYVAARCAACGHDWRPRRFDRRYAWVSTEPGDSR